MQSEWSKLSFAELIRNGSLEIGDGYRAKNDELGGNGLIFLRAGHVTDTHVDFSGVERFKLEGHERFGPKVARVGDVVVTTKGNSTGRVTYITKDMPAFVYSPHLSYWRSTDRSVLHPGFLRAWSRGTEFGAQLAGLSRSTDMAPYLSLSDQRSLTITLPPLVYQEHVAALGDVLQDRIDLLRQTNTTLESIAQALFKSWFIDFDPVRAKQAGREPEGMDAATAALFPAEFDESALGLIPKGWLVTELGAFVELTKGCSYKGVGLSDDQGAYMFNLGCFNAHRVFATEKIKRYTGEYKPRHVVVAGDLIIANTDMTQARDILGRPVFVPDKFEPGFISHHVFKATVKGASSQAVDARRLFLFFSLQQPSFRERAIGYATGTTVLALPATAVTGCQTALSPDDVLQSFADLVRPLLDRIRQNEKQADSLTEVRDTLIPRLISGKLRLPEAQEQLEDALA